MKNEITIQIRAFYVTVEDQRTKERSLELLALDKAQLQAAQVVGQSSQELIQRIFGRQGYRVVAVSKPVKYPLPLDLTGLYTQASQVE